LPGRRRDGRSEVTLVARQFEPFSGTDNTCNDNAQRDRKRRGHDEHAKRLDTYATQLADVADAIDTANE